MTEKSLHFWGAIFLALLVFAYVTGCGSSSSNSPSSPPIVSPTPKPSPIPKPKPTVKHIAIVDNMAKSFKFDRTLLPGYAEAFEYQVNNDVGPEYDTPLFTVTYYANPKDVPAGSWVIHLENVPIVCGGDEEADGCHNVANGLPYAEVDMRFGASTLIDHELLEMIGDPLINYCVNVPNLGAGLREIVDPVDSLYYLSPVNGVPVVDFVRKAWFGNVKATNGYDFGNIVDIHPSAAGVIPHNPPPGRQALGFFEKGC